MAGLRSVLLATTLLAAFLTTTRAQPADAVAHTSTPATPIAAHPYMGWSSWSLESTNYPGVNPTGAASWLTEQHVLAQADVLAAKLASHGYDYVNVDEGWLGGFDAYGRPIPNATTFPDGIRYLADYLHRKGLKLGIYLAVGLDPRAYGTGTTPIFGAPNCQTSDLVYPDKRLTNGWNTSYLIDYASPCAQAYANSIADELAGWQVDFLKMDGVGPGSAQGDANHDNTPDIKAWSAALHRTGRPIQYVLSWSLSHRDAATWAANSNGWRVDTDVECYCGTLVAWNNSVKQRWNDVVQWIPDAGPGHWNNLDSLDVGSGAMDGVTDTERQTYMTLWAIEAAPLYEGDDLTKLDSYGLKLLTNDEVIAVDQAGHPATPISQATDQQVWAARNPDGSETVALFNLGNTSATVTANWADLGLDGTAQVRDLWSHSDEGMANGEFAATLPSHGSRLLRITPHHASEIPVFVHATASTSTSVTLAWDATKAPGYDVYAGAKKVATTRGTSAMITNLTSGTNYRFTVVARNSSTPSQAVEVTTTQAVTYEAEAPANTLAGGASIADCTGCSGGKKIGNIGGNGTLTINNVTAPTAGTYLMRVGYVDGDSSRTAVVTVNGIPFNLPLPGTNDNNWDTAQEITVPVLLNAGSNTIQFGNSADSVSDIDKVTV
jgi:hypothetical protein